MLSLDEKKSQGPLIAFIDLLFLLVAFFILILFFVQNEKTKTEATLENIKENLAEVDMQHSTTTEVLNALGPMVEKFVEQKKREAEKERELSAKDLKKQSKGTIKVTYRLTSEGNIIFDNKTYSLKDFKQKIVRQLRKHKWVAFRAYASPETPFGKVVELRKILLENRGEFDTYWDNTSERAKPSLKKITN